MRPADIADTPHTTTGTVWDWKWSPARRAEILSLWPGETAAATDFVLNTSCARMCSVRIAAEVDADREVTESDERNNGCTFQFLGLVLWTGASSAPAGWRRCRFST